MLLLKTITFPSSAAELACLLNESFRQLFLVHADPVTIRDKSYPHLKELSIALDGASLRDNPPRPSSVQGAVKPAVTADQLTLNASALALGPAVIDVSLSAFSDRTCKNSTAANSHSWRCRWAKSACAMSTSPLATNSLSRLNSVKQPKLPACDSIRHKRPVYATLAAPMIIKIGFDIEFELPGSTPMILMLYVHPSRQRDLRTEEKIVVEPDVPLTDFTDLYGNRCARVLAPAGNVRFSLEALIEDSGQPDEQSPDAIQHPVEEWPSDALPFLLTSRYCEVDKLSDIAWQLFGT